MSSGNTTVPSERAPRPEPPAVAGNVGALTCVWPDRFGEVGLLEGTGPWCLTRGPLQSDSIVFIQQRPGERVVTGPLVGNNNVSKRQALVAYGGASITITNIENAAAALFVNGVEVTGPTPLTEGDIIELRRHGLVQYVFRFETRAATMPALEHYTGARGPFGEADLDDIVGEGPRSWGLRERIAVVAIAKNHVLVVGESGTGKELVARGIHRRSERLRRGALVTCNLAAIPDGLLDSALWGNEINYPNPPTPARPGYVGEAEGGTLMLDEIGAISSSMQGSLLRFFDNNGEYRPQGGKKNLHANVRVIVATNAVSNVRPDIVPRLKSQVEVSPLAMRREDIALLVRHIVLQAAKDNPAIAEKFVRRSGARPEIAIAARFMIALLRRDYPGNIRELARILHRAIETNTGDTLEWSDMLDVVPDQSVQTATTPAMSNEEATLRALLERHQWNASAAARETGMSYDVLKRLIDKYGLRKPK